MKIERVRVGTFKRGGTPVIFFEKWSDYVELYTIRRGITRRTTLSSLATRENSSNKKEEVIDTFMIFEKK